jgi:diguanylate cyclase (GGDEF)-like protein/PAS domain S-box-containing protein
VKQARTHLFVLCVLLAVLLSGVHSALQNVLTDLRFRSLPRQATGDVTLAAIDAYSIEKLGVWPWSRRVYAELVEKLRAAGAGEIVFDVDFSAPSDPQADAAFAEALRKAGGSVVLPSFEQLAGNGANGKNVHINRPITPLAINSWSALVNVAVEPDGLVRRYSFGEVVDREFVPSLAALLAGKYETKAPPFLIDFGIRADSVPMVSFVDLLQGNRAALDKIKGKKIIVGGTALELGDRFSVPNGHVVSGALLQIVATESILQGRVLRASSEVATFSGLLALALLMALLWRRSAAVRVTAFIALAIFAEGVAFLLQMHASFVLDTSFFHVAVIAYLAALALNEIDFRDLLGKIAERRFQLIAMSLGDGLACADENGRVTIWNRGAVAIFGYEAREMIGEPLDKISAPPISILDLPREALKTSGGKLIELEGRRKNGDPFALEACFSAWQGSDGIQFGAILRDVSAKKRELERIRYLAAYDTLTELPNRTTLREALDEKLKEAIAGEFELVLLLVGLDRFKDINDTHGAACGDEVLCTVGRRLRELTETGGIVARIGGDEFAIVIKGVNLAERAESLCKKINAAFGKVTLSGGARQVRVTCGIGIAIYPKDCASADELLANADLALHSAKAEGRGKHVLFEHLIRAEFEARLLLEAELERAAELGEFELYYQPQIDLANGKLLGAEALLRWRHPQRGLLAPADFISVLNASSVSSSVGRWVLETACRQGYVWQQRGRGLRIAVNLSASQLQSSEFVNTLTAVLRETRFLPALLELEITEDILLGDDERLIEIFREIQNLGVNVAFDDYGTGYASLSYLKKFSFDTLKIDRSFVRELREGSDDAAIVASTIDLSKLLGLAVVAEGIEDHTTADILRKMGCDRGQGYYYSRPIPVAEFEAKYLANEPSLSVVRSAATAA